MSLPDGRCIAHMGQWIILGHPAKRSEAYPGELCQLKLENVVTLAENLPQF